MPIGRTIGTIGGGIGGFLIGGPAGAMIGAGAGGMLGSSFDESSAGDPYNTRSRPAYYGGLGAGGEADRASQMGAAGAAGTRALGQQLGADAQHGQVVAGSYQRMAQDRANGLYSNAQDQYGRAEQNAADAAAARGDTMAAIGRLRGFYEQGPGPSAAEAQLRAGNDANARNALSIARTGGGSPSAVRAAMRAAATGGAQTNQQASVLRAQEAANWRNTQLSAMGAEQAALSGVRQGDVGVMGQRLGAAGTQLGAAQGSSQVGLGYGQLGATYGQMNNQARLGAEGLAIGEGQFGETQRGNILGNQLNADTNRYQADRGLAGNVIQANQRQDAANQQFAGSLIGSGVNMLGQQQPSQQTSDVRAKENIQPASAADLIARLDAAQKIAERDTGPSARKTENARGSYDERYGAGNVDLYAQPQVRNPDGSVSTVDSAGFHLDGKEVLLPSVTPDGRHLKSDKDIINEYRKTGRHLGAFNTPEESDRYAETLHDDYAAGRYGMLPTDLRAAQGYSYDYKNPSYGPDNQVGPMAQDLEKTAAAGAVTTGPNGMKQVDPNRLTMTNTAAIGEQQRRLDALEAMIHKTPRIRGERY